MKYVHADRRRALSENCVVGLSLQSHKPISKGAYEYALSQFPDGLSWFGWEHIDEIYQISLGNLTQYNGFYDCLIEHDFEKVRRQRYPHMPSRLQCLFSAQSLLELIQNWPDFVRRDIPIYEVFAKHAYIMDASLLKAYSVLTNFELNEDTPHYEDICKYWECGKSPLPQTEVLLPLNDKIHIGRRLLS